MDDIEKALMEEYLKRITLDIIAKDDWVLMETFKRMYGDKIADVEKFVKDLKSRYFDMEYKRFEQVLKEVEREYNSILPEKQLYYLAATIFAESILNKPAPASLIFEILRCAGMEEEKNFSNRYYFLKQLEKKNLIKKITVINSRAEMLFCPTEEGRKLVNGTEAFNKLIELKDRILNNPQVRKLIEMYSSEEPEIRIEEPTIFTTSQVISEGELIRVNFVRQGNSKFVSGRN